MIKAKALFSCPASLVRFWLFVTKFALVITKTLYYLQPPNLKMKFFFVCLFINVTPSICATWLIDEQVATFSSLLSSYESPQQIIWALLVTVTPATFTIAFAANRQRSSLLLLGSWASKQPFSCSTESDWFRASEESCCRAAACVPSRSAALSSLSFWDVWPRAAEPCVLCSEEISCLTAMFNQHKNNLPGAANRFLFAVPSIRTANILCWFPHTRSLAMASFQPRRLNCR